MNGFPERNSEVIGDVRWGGCADVGCGPYGAL